MTGQREQARSIRRRRLDIFAIIGAVLTTTLALLIGYPLVTMAVREFFPEGVFELSAFSAVVADPKFWEALRNTVILIIIPGALAIIIGGILAWLSERTDVGLRRLTTVLPLISLILPPIALSIGWVFLGDRSVGLLNLAIRWLTGLVGLPLEVGPIDIYSWLGIGWVYLISYVPFAYLLIAPALRNIDPALEEASRTSGGTPFMTLVKVSLPAVLPAIAAAGLMITLVGLAQFSIGRTIGVTARIDVLSVYLVGLFQDYPPRTAEAAAVGVLVLLAVGTTWVLQERLTRRRGHATISGRANTAVRVQLGKARWLGRVLIVGYFAVSTVLPFLALLLVSLQPYWQPQIDVTKFSLQNFIAIQTDPYTWRALLNSVGLGVLGATVALVGASLLVVYTTGRSHRLAGIVAGIARAPSAVSHIVLGVAFLIAFAGAPTYWGGTLLILVLAYIAINMPQAWIAASSAVDQVGRDMIDSSLMSGASMVTTFRLVIFPLITRGLLSGWAFVFVVIVGDLTASAILASTRTPVVGFVILDVFDNGTYSKVAALATTISIISVSVVLLVQWLARPRFRAIGAS